ncbi:MAG: COX15/CtaA family protein [Bdellovibrionales bacterium]|nr:COX15/CtaA family protein [Bdellovibrionales bacterium]
MKRPALIWFAWVSVVYTVGVIMWGAYVRATGSGAGCGRHWPLCNGEIIPRSPAVETLIEYSHRITSGLALGCAIVLFIWTRRVFHSRHLARRAAAAQLTLMVIEALIGAGLVLLELVAHNTSGARAVVVGLHLMNSFLLVGALAATAWWCTFPNTTVLVHSRKALLQFITILSGMLLVGATGAITALGNTLFPSESLRAGIEADFSATAHFLIRLRIIHPALAIGLAALTFGLAFRVFFTTRSTTAKHLCQLVVSVCMLQIALGFANVLLLAPVWLQLSHLFLANVLWIGLVLLAIAEHERRSSFRRDSARFEPTPPQQVVEKRQAIRG